MQLLPQMSPNVGGGPSMYGVAEMSVAKLVVQTAGTYNQQWRRPLSSHSDGRLINMVETMLNTSSNISPFSVAKPALEFLKPSATPETKVSIDNGWETPRYRFMLHIVVRDNMGVITDHYYSGHTQYTDASYGGHIDPSMIFTINSSSSAKRIRREQIGVGVVTLNTPIAHSQILTAPGYQGVMDLNKTYSLRPETVVDDVMSEGLKSMADTFSNTNTYITAPTVSARSNNSAPDYMSKILSTYRNGAIGNLETQGREVTLEHTKKILQDDTGHDKFMAWLQQRRVTGSPGAGLVDVMAFHQFTLNDLLALDATCMQRVKPADSMSIHNDFHVAGQSSDWGASSAEAQTAAMLAAAMPTYMTAYHFNFVHLSATNMTMNGQIEVLVGTAKGVNNAVDTTPFIEAFKQRLTTEMFVSLSHGNSMPFSVEIKCDLLGETWVTISLAQRHEEEFVCPTFCDSLFAPMVTNNSNILSGLSHDFGQIFELVDNQVSSQQFAQGNWADQNGNFLQTPKLIVPGSTIPLLQPVNVQPVVQPSFNPSPFGNKNPGF